MRYKQVEFTDTELSRFNIKRELYHRFGQWLESNHKDHDRGEYLAHVAFHHFGLTQHLHDDEHPIWEMCEIYFSEA